jgi:putative DNA-invertase from lambdoid prophage Rac
LDRLGRSLIDVLHTVRELNGRGVTVVVTSQNMVARPVGDAVTNLILAVLGAAAEFERDLIRERTRLGMDRVRRQGTKSGKPIGRRRRGTNPSKEAVLAARGDGSVSWAAVAERLGCTVAMARPALERPAVATGDHP